MALPPSSSSRQCSPSADMDQRAYISRFRVLSDFARNRVFGNPLGVGLKHVRHAERVYGWQLIGMQLPDHRLDTSVAFFRRLDHYAEFLIILGRSLPGINAFDRRYLGTGCQFTFNKRRRNRARLLEAVDRG